MIGVLKGQFLHRQTNIEDTHEKQKKNRGLEHILPSEPRKESNNPPKSLLQTCSNHNTTQLWYFAVTALANQYLHV